MLPLGHRILESKLHPSSQPFTLRAGAVFALTGAGLYYYFQSEKAAQLQRKAAETATAKIGRPKIGGPFVLTDQNGNQFSDEDMLGKWSLVYVSRLVSCWVERRDVGVMGKREGGWEWRVDAECVGWWC